jgi:hypothetical protein
VECRHAISSAGNQRQSQPGVYKIGYGPLIQHLPETTLDLTHMPHHLLRQLCDAFALRITYNKHTHQADFNIDIAAHTIPRIQQLAIPSTTKTANTHGQFCDEPRPGFEPAQLTELDAFVLVKDVCVVVESLLGHVHYPYRLVGWSR